MYTIKSENGNDQEEKNKRSLPFFRKRRWSSDEEFVASTLWIGQPITIYSPPLRKK